MIAFEIHLNGEKLCVAGIGEHGVLSQHLSWVGRNPKADEEEVQTREPHLHVGGLVNDEHLNWIKQTSVNVGDEIVIAIVEIASADEPIHRERAETDEERAQKVRKKCATVWMRPKRGCRRRLSKANGWRVCEVITNCWRRASRKWASKLWRSWAI